jgi:hypothetical protein
VWRQLKWLLPLVFCWSDPDVPRWDLGAVTSERCSAIVGLTNGSGLVARVNQHNGFPVMRSLTGEVKPISRDRWSDLCIRSHIVSVKSFRLQSGVVYFVPLIVTQHQHQDYVNRRQSSKRVTEGSMDDVPEMQHTMRFRQEENLFRQQCLFTRHGDGPLQNSVLTSAQSHE